MKQSLHRRFATILCLLFLLPAIKAGADNPAPDTSATPAPVSAVPKKNVPAVPGKIDESRVFVVNTGQARFFITPSDQVQGHSLTVTDADGKILDIWTPDDTDAGKSHTVDFPKEWAEVGPTEVKTPTGWSIGTPQNWNEPGSIQLRDGTKVLGELTRKQVLQDMQTRADAMTCYFSQYVFSSADFPSFQIEQEGALRDYFKPLDVKTTFYNAQFEEVKKADKPGRYGALVSITMPWGVERIKFIALYKTSDGGKPDAPMTNPTAKEVDTAENAAVRMAGLDEAPAAELDAHIRTSAMMRNDAWWAGLRKHIGMTVPCAYFVDLPHDMTADPNKKWPLILFLHGWKESGWDINRIRSAGLVRMLGDGKQVPAIVVSPLRPSDPDSRWHEYILTQVLDAVEAKYNIDLDRVYVTGLSMGGRGTWRMGLFFPERFAAIVPVAGDADPTDAAQLINLPVWAFHGDKDLSVALKLDTDMNDAICKAGGHPHLTILAGANHSDKTWNTVYGMDALYKWLLAQKRGQPEVTVPGVQPPQPVETIPFVAVPGVQKP